MPLLVTPRIAAGGAATATPAQRCEPDPNSEATKSLPTGQKANARRRGLR